MTRRARTPDSSSHAGARFFCQLINKERPQRQGSERLLVAGCGHGGEAAYLCDTLGVTVDAVDIWLDRGTSLPERTRLSFHECDLLSLPFESGCFDMIFYHHVIEHVKDATASLAELARVLRPDGCMFIGTPNRHRIVGSLGAHERTTRHKIRENFQAWQMRLRGRFRNECGAHAGFSERELDVMLNPYFDERRWITHQYLRFKYQSGFGSWCARLATLSVWRDIAVPSVYAMCYPHKQTTGAQRQGLSLPGESGRS